MYASQSNSQPTQFSSTYVFPSRQEPRIEKETKQYFEAASPYTDHDVSPLHSAPSGGDIPIQLTPFEQKQLQLLTQLIQNAARGSPDDPRKLNCNEDNDRLPANSANKNPMLSFSFPVNDDTFTQTSPKHRQFSKTSSDDINTRFAQDGDVGSWRFNAGGGESPSPSRPPHRPAKEQEPQASPHRPNVLHNGSDVRPVSAASEQGFNADGWNDKFQPGMFVPRPEPGKTASPTRPVRKESRKLRTTRTAGTASLIDDSSSDDEIQWRGRKAQGESIAIPSPQAMDIDSPPAPPPRPEIPARNIHVEPSRPEWRPGNAAATNEDEASETKPFNSNAQGSEDSEEFQASLADMKNVPPFTQQGEAGFGSFSDLKDNLPFESKASSETPFRLPKIVPLDFPMPPVAPPLPQAGSTSVGKPATAVWQKYVKDFELYLERWDQFNGQVVDHFATRKSQIARQRESKGYTFLENRADADVQDYYAWLEQDKDVRRRWSEACQEHERHYRDFMAFRMRMKSS